jgi:NAD(P)-dependent dehydrogenase (short-subunit alcohol dehydrogenase family)
VSISLLLTSAASRRGDNRDGKAGVKAAGPGLMSQSQKVVKVFGDSKRLRKIDILVNNAGITERAYHEDEGRRLGCCD